MQRDQATREPLWDQGGAASRQEIPASFTWRYLGLWVNEESSETTSLQCGGSKCRSTTGTGAWIQGIAIRMKHGACFVVQFQKPLVCTI